MGKVLSFPSGADKEQWAKEIYKAIMERGDKVAVVIQTPEQVETGYFNCSVIEKQVMVGHLQIDIIHDVMRATYDLDPLE